MHVVGFDATGESIELRITARDRSAYVAGALLASDWLMATPNRPAGLVRFESVVKRMLDSSAAPDGQPSTSDHRQPDPVTAVTAGFNATTSEDSNGHR